MAARSTKKAVDFESALNELEALVSSMEEGDLSLEESLAAFEKGIKLTRECQSMLSSAEQRVQQLMEKNGEPVLSEFDTDAT